MSRTDRQNPRNELLTFGRRPECATRSTVRVIRGMSKLPRRILPDRLYEITHKTFQARYFFIPSRRLNELILGALAYSTEKYGLRFCYTAWRTNHYHHLIRADSAKQLAEVLRLANCQIANEVQKLSTAAGRPWTGGVFGSDGASVVEVVGGKEIQLERLRYLMSQGVKEGLCPHPTKWPSNQRQHGSRDQCN